MEAILADFERLVVPAMTHWNHPGFLAYFANSSPPEGILGELYAAALNGNGMLWKTSPAVTELEQVALRWLRQWCGLPEDSVRPDLRHRVHRQHACHRRRAPGRRPRIAHPRHRAGSGRLHLRTGALFPIEKGAIAVGIGRTSSAKSPWTRVRMRPEALQGLIEADLAAGLRPCCVAATVGTTSTTSVDPVPAIASLCERHGLWLHVDAAYAGSAAVAPEFRWAFEGCDRADSFVTNPHKWLLTPMDCSIFYTRRPEVLRRAFSLIPEYLETAQDPRAVNLMDYGVPLGRRFRALKLWFVLRSYGREGLAAMIRCHVALAQGFALQVDADPLFERTAPSPFSVVCFRYKGSDDQNRRILEAVNATGEVFLSGTVLKGRYSLHLAVGNHGTTQSHVDRAWTLVKHAAARL